jgi:hypothetical protein
MGWGYDSKTYNSARIPLITGYAFMKEHFERVKPILGRATECKPLGANRRMSWYEVAKNVNCYMSEEEPLGRLEDSYVCRLNNRDMVEFYRDGSVVIRDNSWHSPTAMGFLTHSLKHFGDIRSHAGKWYFANKKGDQYLLSKEGLRIVDAGDGLYEPTNPIREHTYTAKRKVLNKYRKQYKEFMDYTRTMLGMDNRVTMDTTDALGFEGRALTADNSWARSRAHDNRAKFMDYLDKVTASNNLDLSYSLAQYAAASFGGYEYSAKGVVCSPKQFDRGFAEVLKYAFADEAFEAHPVPLGTPAGNLNQKYMKSN